jgi:thiol-disulfide isomerase/thioredoxin
MSTLRLSVVLLILLALLGLVGCTSTSSYRTTASAPKMRTVATIGDRPLPSVTGEPGAAVTSEGEPEPPLERHSPAGADGRISGRVVDEQGEPVGGARVRLAVSSAPGGRVVQATTDRSGGFTLRGLRPGASYTVIAEREDDQGVLTGRSTVQAPDADVRIALGSDETAPRPVDLPARVNPVSRRGATDEPADLVASPINVEDLPPAAEAEALAPASRRRTRVDPDENESTASPRSGGWRPLDRAQPVSSDPAPGTPRNARSRRAVDAEPPLRPGQGASLPPIEAPVPDDDGPNPLPPALEPGETSQSVPAPEDPAAPEVKVAAELPAAPGADPATLLASADLPTPLPDLPPGALVAAPPSTPAAPSPAPLPDGPIASGDPPAALPPPVESSAPEPEPADPAPRPRPRWRDLAAGQSSPPPLENAVRGSPPTEPDRYCHYDTRHRRIEDFRLPDLQGRPVRFQDFDADLILLDFWGSWCQPCLRSVPHLVDLQKRLGGKQLQVIGIACERQEAPEAERVARAAGAAKKLGMNYPVLVTTNDGSCPLQKALHVQSYPTLILVDCQGRILWQEQGATRLTMMRLDRMINMAAKPTDGRRRF